MKYLFVLLMSIASLSCTNGKKIISSKTSRPNIIYILADDLGYGDLSCYGQYKFSTPNIDALANKGMLFTQHYSGSTVCAPSRSALLTGLHTGNTPIRGNQEVKTEGQWPMPDSTYTIAELLKRQGYSTGTFGKWGLGYPNSEGDPLNQGFDTFYGYNCQRIAHNHYPFYLWDNDKKVVLEGNIGSKTEQYAPNLIHQEALKFINKHKNQPFFLYYASIIPHAELFAPEKYMTKHIGRYGLEKPFEGTDSGQKYKGGAYGSQENPHAAFAAMINLLDDQVGEIVKKVEDLGIEENTIFIFSSDNGPHHEGGADPEYFNSSGGLRGIKRDLFEGGIKVPMIVAWKGKIIKATKADHISAFWDVMPTIADILNVKLPKKTDGISFLPTLTGAGEQKKHDYLYWEFHERKGRQAIRNNDWKLVKYDVKDNPKYYLFDLESDPAETNNLSEEKPELLNKLKSILEISRSENPNFKLLKK